VGETTELISAIALVLQAICWPLFLLIVVAIFVRPLNGFLSGLSEFRVKADATGIEAMAKKSEVVANLAVAAATTDRDERISTHTPTEIAQVVDSYSGRQILRLSDKRVLWVDDTPSNNVYERNALKALGIDTEISLSTKDALEKMQRARFDLVISDFARVDDKAAGYTLLEELRKAGYQMPYIIYSGSTTGEFAREARRRGAYGQTNRPVELFQMVLNALLERG
jgi:CheY-like chemotaxis protein